MMNFDRPIGIALLVSGALVLVAAFAVALGGCP